MLSIGERVRRLRREQDITQATLAKRAGLWTNTVNRVEKDHVVPSSETLAKIAHGLGVSVGELYPEEPAGKDDPLSGAGVSEVERRGLERLAALLDSLGAESADLANPRLTQELESLPSQQFLAALHQLQEEIDVLTPVLDEMREATTPRDPNYLDFTYLWSSAARQFHLIKMLVRARAHVEPQIEQAREVRELLEVIP
jgi:transcriptional regulator with XRE-family HTH domain